MRPIGPPLDQRVSDERAAAGFSTGAGPVAFDSTRVTPLVAAPARFGSPVFGFAMAILDS
jgi:hypothetical protein